MQRLDIAPQFAVCIRNQGCEDLELRKLYQVLPTESPSEEGYLRVIDESGEDYLYPADYFILLELPLSVKRVLLTAA